MKLTILERLTLPNFIPERAGLITMRLSRNILDMVAFTTEEITRFELEDLSEGRIKWNKNKEEIKEFNFSKEQMFILKEKVKELDGNGQITHEMLDLAIKINEY